MFKFLKDKLKGALSVFSKKVKEEIKEEIVEKPVEKKPEKIVEEPIKKIEPAKEEPGKVEKKAEISEPKKPALPAIRKIILPAKKEAVKESRIPEKPVKEPVIEKPIEKKEIIEEKRPAEKIEVKKPEEIELIVEKREEPKKQGFFGRLFKKKEAEEKAEVKPEVEPIETAEKEEIEQQAEEPVLEEPEEKKSIFAKVKERFTRMSLSPEKFEQIFWDLEVVLLENNVAVEVIEKIKEDLKEELTTNKVSRKGIDEVIQETLKRSIEELFEIESVDLLKEAKKKKPYIICMIGVNGSGKTTTMAKLANLFLKNRMSVVFAAADTFRAAAIQQLEEHADRLGIKLIKQDYKADPAAVAFDAIQHARAKGIDVVLIDTAGRQHSNDNLMNELKKLVRVNKPDMKIFVGESITGNDCIEQAKTFDEAVGIDAIILAKADVDEKGGAAISVSYITKKPILYLGVGQDYDSLKRFEPKLVVESLGL